jgi:hypothetical protein
MFGKRAISVKASRCPSAQPISLMVTTGVHTPPLQICSAGHTFPQRPQCSRSAPRSTHRPAHNVVPAAHEGTHAPATHT